MSTPLRWDEVNEELDPAAFTMDVVLERVERYGDLYEGVLTTKQRLADALQRPLAKTMQRGVARVAASLRAREDPR